MAAQTPGQRLFDKLRNYDFDKPYKEIKGYILGLAGDFREIGVNDSLSKAVQRAEKHGLIWPKGTRLTDTERGRLLGLLDDLEDAPETPEPQSLLRPGEYFIQPINEALEESDYEAQSA